MLAVFYEILNQNDAKATRDQGNISIEILDTENRVINTLRVRGETHDSYSTTVETSGDYRVCILASK